MLIIVDFDPEEDAPPQRSDEETEDSDDELAGTEHYAAVKYVSKIVVSFHS